MFILNQQEVKIVLLRSNNKMFLWLIHFQIYNYNFPDSRIRETEGFLTLIRVACRPLLKVGLDFSQQ